MKLKVKYTYSCPKCKRKFGCDKILNNNDNKKPLCFLCCLKKRQEERDNIFAGEQWRLHQAEQIISEFKKEITGGSLK